jgi:hypothetical protein
MFLEVGAVEGFVSLNVAPRQIPQINETVVELALYNFRGQKSIDRLGGGIIPDDVVPH